MSKITSYIDVYNTGAYTLISTRASLTSILYARTVQSHIMSTVEPDLIAAEMFPSKSSRNKNDSDLMIAIP